MILRRGAPPRLARIAGVRGPPGRRGLAGRALGDVLVEQDPHRRIRFEQAVPLSLWALRTASDRAREIRLIFGSGASVRATALVPMWLLGILTHSLDYARVIETGQREDRYLERQYQALMGCCASAAPLDHWAHGVMLPDSLATRLKLLPVYEPTAAEYVRPIVGEPLLPSEWDRDSAPLFAYGPPALDRAADTALAYLQIGEGSTEGYREQREPVRPSRVFAVPHYRLMHLVDTPRGEIIYHPSIFMRGAGQIALDRAAPGPRFTPPWFSTPGHPPRVRSDAGLQWREKDRDEEQVVTFTHMEGEAGALYNIVYRAMVSRPGAGADAPSAASWWRDGRVMPFNDVPERPTGKTAAELTDYFDECLMGREPATEPAYFTASEARPRQTLSIPPATRSARPPPPPPPRRGPAAPPPGAAGPSRLAGAAGAYASAFKRGRDAETTRRLGAEKARLERWGAARAGSAGGGGGGGGGDVRVVAALYDGGKHYKALDIVPDARYLRPESAEQVDEELKRRRNELALRYHADRASGSKNAERMVEINNAMDKIQTWTGRLMYQAEALNPGKKTT